MRTFSSLLLCTTLFFATPPTESPADAKERFLQTLKRTPGRPKAIYGIARGAQATGDKATAHQSYQQFLTLWKNADPDRPEVTTAKEFLAKQPAAAE